MSMSKQRNDNKDGQRGDFYQALVAIKYAIEYTNKTFDNLTLEHRGDITFDTHQQIEVKHHAPKCSLGDSHIDFWNTLYNWCIDENEYEKLIFHTTAYFPKTQSLLRTWNNQSIDNRYDTIHRIIKSNTAKGVIDFMDFIKLLDAEKLKSVISKVEIKSDQPIDTELIQLLMKNPTIQSISCKPEDREELVKTRLGGFVQSKVAGEKEWKISWNQFFVTLQSIGRDFANENYNPIFDKYLNAEIEEKEYSQYTEKRFVEELVKIKCDEDEVREAINDFWKTSTLIAEETERNPAFYDHEFHPYKKEKVFPLLKNKKRLSLLERPNDSLYFYRHAKQINVGAFKSIPSDLLYFKHGTMQNIVEDNELKFSWLYE